MKQRHQSGNVLFIILIACALFAALAYAVTKSSREPNTMATKEQAAINAAAVMQYFTRLKTTVDRLRLASECADNQISFENSIVSGYTNNNAPPSKKCHVFDPAGGGLTWQNTLEPGSAYVPYFTGHEVVPGMGTQPPAWLSPKGSELLGGVQVSLATAMKINDGMGIENFTNHWMYGDTPPGVHHPLNSTKFVGNYVAAETISANFGTIEGKRTACFQNAAGGGYSHNYYCFTVLIAR